MSRLTITAVAAISAGLLSGCGDERKAACERALRGLQERSEVRIPGSGVVWTKEDQRKTRAFFGVLNERCARDAWPPEVVKCTAEAAHLEQFEKDCMTRLSQAQVAALGEAVERKENALEEEAAIREVKVKQMLRKLELEAYLLWRDAHPEQKCPANVFHLLDHVKGQAKDPWGQEYRVHCAIGDSLELDRFQVSSDGPDGEQNTNDDIRL